MKINLVLNLLPFSNVLDIVSEYIRIFSLITL